MFAVAAASSEISWAFIELGVAMVGLAILARLASRLGLSAIPLYLLAGLAFGKGGLLPVRFTESFVNLGAEIGVVLLLFMLGLEYSGEELRASLRKGLPAGAVDFVLNFTPGLVAGLLLGWSPVASWLLGGVTYVTSSGIVCKLLVDCGVLCGAERPTVMTILVLEDLAMAVFLPLTTVLLLGQPLVAGLSSIVIALVTAGVFLAVAFRYGPAISRLIGHDLDEIILLTTLGIVLLVAGIAQRLQVSAAVGAFLVGIALSGPIVHKVHRLVGPLRDLFAAIFFLFFGLDIAPATLPPVLAPAIALAVVTILTKLATGWWAARRNGCDALTRLKAGICLAARGEFSIIVAGLGVSAGLDPSLGTTSAAYVILLAVTGPILGRFVEPVWTMMRGARR